MEAEEEDSEEEEESEEVAQRGVAWIVVLARGRPLAGWPLENKSLQVKPRYPGVLCYLA